MQPTFDQYHKGFGAELKCPSCNENYLRHVKVEVFDRTEDQKDGIHVIIGKQIVHVDKDLNGNPSDRRHGLKIYMQCENCDCEPVLIISQHKGQTHVDMRCESES